MFGQQAAQKPGPLPIALPIGPSEDEYYFLACKFKSEKREVIQSFTSLLKEKDKTIRVLLQYIFELKKGSKSPGCGVSLEPLKQLESGPSLAGKKFSLQQLQKTGEISAVGYSSRRLGDILKIYFYRKAMNRWWDRLPPSSGVSNSGSILEGVLKNCHEEMTGIKESRFTKASKAWLEV